ncbi:MAG: SHOCT domain-containing protein [Saccharofermentanales bacterium]
MMKKLLAIVLTIMLVSILTMAAGVSAEEMAPQSIDAVLTEIKADQGVQDNEKIDIEKVSQDQLEELGDSVMEAIIGNTAMHEQMDNRIGGDGSAALTAFHIKLGYNYLAGYPIGMRSLMSSGMMRPNGVVRNNGGFRGMMGNNFWGNNGMMGNYGWIGLLVGSILLIMFILLIVFVIRALTKKPNNNSMNSPMNSSMNILKERYAKGEITREEYETMRKNLEK